MRIQEQKQYDENGNYIHKCMKQNCNREETEGEELTALERGELSLQEVSWLYDMGEETQAFRQDFLIHLVFLVLVHLAI